MPTDFESRVSLKVREGVGAGDRELVAGKNSKKCDKSDNDDNFKGDNKNNSRLHLICIEWE